MARFQSRDGQLYIDGKRVLRGWESWTGWFWFATEKDGTQDSVLPDGTVAEGDTIWFGLVQGIVEEWGTWSQAELETQMRQGRVWEIPKRNLPYSGRRT